MFVLSHGLDQDLIAVPFWEKDVNGKKLFVPFSLVSKTRFGDICVKSVSMKRVEKLSSITIMSETTHCGMTKK